MQELNVWAIVSSLNQISNFSSNSQMAIYLESLSSMVHFSFNHVKELELSHICAKRQVKAKGRFFPEGFEIYCMVCTICGEDCLGQTKDFRKRMNNHKSDIRGTPTADILGVYKHIHYCQLQKYNTFRDPLFVSYHF